MSYFPQVTVARSGVKIRRERLLPRPGEVAVRPGQDVTPIHVVARAAEETGFHILRASEVLNVAPESLRDYLLVEEGTALERGMPLLRKRNFLGQTRRYGSPVDGVLFQVRDGNLILRLNPRLFELRAQMNGFIVNVFPGRGVSIETTGTLIEALWGSGKEGFGKLHLAAEDREAPIEATAVGAAAAGNVLVGGRLDNLETLGTALTSGARGIVVGSVSAPILAAASTIPIPILVTDGVGKMPMSPPIFERLQAAAGREASLFGVYGSPRGQRPAIVIPDEARGNADPLPEAGAAITAGQTVRILRGAHAGAIGEVMTLYAQPHTTSIETRVPGADVKVGEGEVTFVPYTNLDLIM